MVRQTGSYVTTTTVGETVKAFVPKPLPPDPPVDIDSQLDQLLHRAERRLHELRIAASLVPNADLFNYAFVRKEAILSAQIEGVQATLTDLLDYEGDPESGPPDKNIQEVCNYLEALHYGRKQIKHPQGLPLSLRLIKEMHKRLMRSVRGSSKGPGTFRKSQNWIGGTRPGNAHFVPPPPKEMLHSLQQLESFFHQKNEMHPLIKIAMIHVQFETIHPFLDGNGRLGRLLIALLVEIWQLLDARLLYLSLFFKRNRQEYYQSLDSVRFQGNFEAWILFFLEGISVACEEAIITAKQLFELINKDRKRLLGRSEANVAALRLFEQLPQHPVITVAHIVKLLNVTKPTAAKAIDILIKAKILAQTAAAKRNRRFGYKNYIRILRGKDDL